MERRRPLAEKICDAPGDCPVVGACPQGCSTPCLDLAGAHAAKLRLCGELESIADALPSQVDRLLCLQIASELVPQLRECHRYEEASLFPAFVKGAADPASRLASVRRLEMEHIQDECAAQDLTDVLLAIGHGAPVENPEALGFMLRAFFESVRRHIAFEREHLVMPPGEGAAG